MMLVNLFLNILVSTFGICFIIGAHRDIKRNWYPKWIGILEIITGIFVTIWGFAIWFMV